jgi:hypothetical protein
MEYAICHAASISVIIENRCWLERPSSFFYYVEQVHDVYISLMTLKNHTKNILQLYKLMLQLRVKLMYSGTFHPSPLLTFTRNKLPTPKNISPISGSLNIFVHTVN